MKKNKKIGGGGNNSKKVGCLLENMMIPKACGKDKDITMWRKWKGAVTKYIDGEQSMAWKNAGDAVSNFESPVA